MTVFFSQLINGLSLGSIYALIALGHTLFYPAFRGNIPSFQAFFIHFINTVSINNQSLMHLFFPFSFIVFIQTGILS